MTQTPPPPPGNLLSETLRGLFGPLLDLIKGWPPLLSFGGVTIFLVVILSLLGAVVPDNLVPLLYLAFVLTWAAFVWLLWDERRRASSQPAPEPVAQPEGRLEDDMQQDKSTPPPAAPDQRGQTVHGAQTNIGQSEGPVLSGVFHAPVTVGATPQPPPQAPGAAPPDADPELDRLHQVLRARFDREELRTLCFRLGVNHDDLGGEGHSARARELVRYMKRRIGGLERLRAAIEAARPGALG